jgi:hypothetical protein
LALTVMTTLLLLGFVVVLVRNKGQLEAASLSTIPSPTPKESSTLSVLPSPTPQESSTLSVIPTPAPKESPTAAPDTSTPTGPPAPDFTLPDLDGTMWSLSQFRGRPVVLFFWATW